MEKKRKLESGLEGLFSKTKGKDKSPEKAQVEYIPTPPGNPIKNEKADSNPQGGSEADQQPEISKPEFQNLQNSFPPEKDTQAKPERAKPGQKADSQETARIPIPGAGQTATFEEAQPAAKAKKTEPTPENVNQIPQPDDEPVSNLDVTTLANFHPGEQALALVHDEKEDEKQMLIFRICDVDYAVEVEFVQTIIKPQTVFLVPGTDPFIKGLINLRGEVVPVVDLHIRFNVPLQDTNNNTRFVVIEIGELKASLVVDAVQGVITIPRSLIEKPSNMVSDIDTQYLKGIARLEGQLVLILDVEQTIRVSVES